MMEKVPETLAQAEVLDQDGHPRKMAELWADKPAVVHFVRHFG
jgi:hypothetical protein